VASHVDFDDETAERSDPMIFAIVVTFLLVSMCLALFLLLFLGQNRTAPEGLVGDSPKQPIAGLSAVCVQQADLLFGQDDYRKLRMRPGLKSVSDRFWHDRRRIALRWLGDLEGDVRVLWEFRRFLVGRGLQVTLREELAVACSALLALVYLRFLRVGVFLSGPFLLVGALRSSRLFVEGLWGRSAALLARVPAGMKTEIEHAWTQYLLVLGARPG
jgi:hypothetical protein